MPLLVSNMADALTCDSVLYVQTKKHNARYVLPGKQCIQYGLMHLACAHCDQQLFRKIKKFYIFGTRYRVVLIVLEWGVGGWEGTALPCPAPIVLPSSSYIIKAGYI